MKFADGNGYLNILFYVLVGIVILASNAYRSYVKSKEQQNRKPGENTFPLFDKRPGTISRLFLFSFKSGPAS